MVEKAKHHIREGDIFQIVLSNRLEEELLADEKERAEHNMLVDLGRNDIGKISKFGTVEVEKYMSIERYSHVMHIGSTVRGEIRDNQYDALDTMPECLKTVAVTEDGEIMAVCHEKYPVYGMQFHPESIMTPMGKKMLENFIPMYKLA